MMADRTDKTTQKGNRVIPILGALLAVLVVVMIVTLSLTKNKTAAFTPPPFEENAVAGIPEVAENLGYSSPYREGMAYRFSVCGNVTASGNDAAVYLTNPKENEVWLKLRVLDEGGQLLGETGLLRPGEYVQYVTLKTVPPAGTKIILKIMGYEPETYHSAGSATLSTLMGEATN